METVPTIGVGIDHGNSHVTITRILDGGGVKRVSFPAANTPGSISDIAGGKILVGKNILNEHEALEPGDHVLVFRDQSWFIGERAFQDVKIPSTGSSDMKRYQSDACLRNILTGIAAIIPSEVTRCRIMGVMCIPLDLARNEDTIKHIRRHLNGGPYQIVYNGRPIHIDELRISKILAESIGPAIRHNPPADRKTAVFDSGYFSFDYSTLRGLKPILDKCGTIKLGVRDIAQYITKQCEREYRHSLTQSDTESILRSYTAIERYQESLHEDVDITELFHDTQQKKSEVDAPLYPYIETAKGEIQTEDLHRWTTQGVHIIGEQLAEQLAGEIGTNNDGQIAADCSSVYFVGGGFYYFGKVFRKRIASRKIHQSEQPEFDTADGLAYFAREIALRRTEIKDVQAS